MKFADYFKDAIEYGKSLGLRHEIKEGDDDWRVALTVPDETTYKGKTFYPIFLTVWGDSGLYVDCLSPIDKPIIKPTQQVKLIKLFTDSYEHYLQDQEAQDGR